MLILILLCFALAIAFGIVRAFQTTPPPRPHFGWVAFAFMALGFLIEFASRWKP